ncbi:MAG: CoA-binding protein [Bryobacteraceae bacterium]|nr:CoA-binding protein [Bryobacteraceae bacterium]
MTRELIDRFLAQPRFAFVGLSRNPRDFSRMLAAEFERRGYEVVGVNPSDPQALARLQDIRPPVQAALLMTSSTATEQVVRDAAEARVTLLWMYSAGAGGAISEKAIDFCAEHDIDVIAGYCPYQFFPDAGFPHNLHVFFLKLTGTYPRQPA